MIQIVYSFFVHGFVALALVASLAGLAAAGPAEDVQAAYNAERAEDYVKAVSLYERAAAGNNMFAMNNLGDMYYSGRGVKRSWVDAMKWYRQGADKGNADAQHAVGMMYERGESVKKNATQAAQWYTKAGNQGLSRSQNALGVLFTTGGIGLKANPLRAYFWFTLAGKEDRSAVSRSERAKAKLSTEQLERAEKVLADWKPKKS